jgi:tRNA A37 threonylcarbamoyladenosine biosynthesis protein TsaE
VRSSGRSGGCLDSVADLNSEEMEPRDRSAWKPTTSTFEGVCLCEWHEEIRKRIPLHFLQVKVVAYQQSVDSGFRSTVK